jgi:hypothetical protein
MYNNNSFYPYYNNLQNIAGFRITPVARIEEANSIFPDLQGNPLFFFDQSRNEFYVKQRKPQTGEVETLKYTLSKEPVSAVSTPNYGEMIQELREEIKRIGEAASVKLRKVDKDVE